MKTRECQRSFLADLTQHNRIANNNNNNNYNNNYNNNNMTIRKRNKNSVSIETDWHVCRFLTSPFRVLGFKAYKSYHDISLPDPSRKVSNRIHYMRRLQETNPRRFLEICVVHGVASEDATATRPLLVATVTKTFFHHPDKPTSGMVPVASTSGVVPVTPKSFCASVPPTVPSRASERIARAQNRSVHWDVPHMLCFRDEQNGEIGNAFCGIVTIHQPLCDP